MRLTPYMRHSFRHTYPLHAPHLLSSLPRHTPREIGAETFGGSCSYLQSVTPYMRHSHHHVHPRYASHILSSSSPTCAIASLTFVSVSTLAPVQLTSDMRLTSTLAHPRHEPYSRYSPYSPYSRCTLVSRLPELAAGFSLEEAYSREAPTAPTGRPRVGLVASHPPTHPPTHPPLCMCSACSVMCAKHRETKINAAKKIEIIGQGR